MFWLLAFGAVILICFAGVILVGAPYLPTLTPQVRTAIDIARLKKGQTMLELGCGDGKILVAAAQKGIYVIGYELNPFLVAIAWLRTRKYKKYVHIIWGNYWAIEWPKADAIFVFLLPKYMDKLDKKCMQYSYRPVKLISFAFTVPARKPTQEANGVFVYTYKS